MPRASLVLLAGLAACRTAPSLDLSRYELVDLSHPYSAATLYWPTSPSAFELKPLHVGPTPAGFFYSAYTFATPEHGGTHLDAPVHFFQAGASVERIPLNQLVAPAAVLDVRDSAAANPDYRLIPADIEAFERAHGRIAAGTIVLLHTGWSSRWGDRKGYFGDDTRGDATKLHFPGYGAEAARILVEERKVAALGVDSPSVDYGPAQDFPVHRLGAPHGVPNFANLANLDRLPATGALVVALPMKIEGGSGAPLRAVALLPRGR